MTAATWPEGSLACVTGRFQPVHEDHLRLFRRALTAADRLVVGITNPDPGTRRPEPTSGHRHRAEDNPFTYFERVELLVAALAGDDDLGAEQAGQVRFVPFDLGRSEHWGHYVPLRAVQYVGVYGPWEQEKVHRLGAAGYQVVAVPGDERNRRTSSAVRAALRRDAGWQQLVPPATVQPLAALLQQRREAGTPL